jgi:hypothetical protein
MTTMSAQRRGSLMSAPKPFDTQAIERPPDAVELILVCEAFTGVSVDPAPRRLVGLERPRQDAAAAVSNPAAREAIASVP